MELQIGNVVDKSQTKSNQIPENSAGVWTPAEGTPLFLKRIHQILLLNPLPSRSEYSALQESFPCLSENARIILPRVNYFDIITGRVFAPCAVEVFFGGLREELKSGPERSVFKRGSI
jgi:hypothetical protein